MNYPGETVGSKHGFMIPWEDYLSLEVTDGGCTC